MSSEHTAPVSRPKSTGLHTGEIRPGVAKVDPILVTDDSGEVVPDTSATGGGGASLWEVSFRGRPTASMVYDRLPVIDHFVVVDTTTDPTTGASRPSTLLAVMNGRGTVSDGEYFWFLLDRED